MLIKPHRDQSSEPCLERFHVIVPKIIARAFIDDMYIWGQADAIEQLSQAHQASCYWDALTGQVSNLAKCQTWATCSKVRTKMNKFFPAMKNVLTLECLGTRLMLSNRKIFEWPEEKTKKICRDLAAIRAIPCTWSIMEHIISAKTIPQINFNPHLGQIPKKALDSLRNAIAAAGRTDPLEVQRSLPRNQQSIHYYHECVCFYQKCFATNAPDVGGYAPC